MNAYTKLAVLSTIFAAAIRSVTSTAEVPPQPPLTTTNSLALTELSPPKSSVWEDGIGRGFLPSAQNLTLEAGVSSGVAAFGGQQAHDLALLSAAYGHMLGPVLAKDHWWRGNFEGRMELFGGAQFHPDVDAKGWFVGLTPHLRYNFATGSRLIPFLDAGAGVTAMGIGPPDVSGTFEFNLQASTGVRWFIRNTLAPTAELRYIHFSCAGIHDPNLGINTVAGLLGVSWFFGK